jgi:3-hydroxyisobutyrate dehydrogenase-like beta-hydroxyacid dehydrogenase
MVAGRAEPTLARSQPLFDVLGRQTFIAGAEPWQANAIKLCGNYMIASLIETFGEAFATLRKANVPPQLFLEVMNTLFGSPIYANYGRMIGAEKFEPTGFALTPGLKDVRLALAAAEELTACMPLASLLKDQFLAPARPGWIGPAWRESRPATQGCDTDRNLLTPVSSPLTNHFGLVLDRNYGRIRLPGCALRPTA